MAVISFKEIHEGREGGVQLSGKRSTVATHTRVFRVKTDSNYDDEVTILEYADCPREGDQHPTNSDAYCKSVRARNESFSKRVWIVSVEYSTEREISITPTAEPAEVTWSTEFYQRPYFQDKDGYGIVNSAGDPYDPPVEGDDARWVATVTKNVDQVPSWLLTYRNAVNSDTFVLDGLPIAAGYAKLMGVSIGKWEKRDVFWYRSVSLTIAVDSNGWAKQILDAGFREISGSLRVNIQVNGEDVTAPVPLNGSGVSIAQPTANNVVFRTHNIYPSLPFSVLPLS
jgi:hypothetical protein